MMSRRATRTVIAGDSSTRIGSSVWSFALTPNGWRLRRGAELEHAQTQILHNAHLTQLDCDRLAAKVNRRPRKLLGYRTPEECYVR